MTVAEMIIHLSKLDPALPVLVEGYEFGYDEALPPTRVTVRRVVKPKSYAGDFQDVGCDFTDVEGDTIEAVLIGERDS